MTAARWQGGGPPSNFGAVKKSWAKGGPRGISIERSARKRETSELGKSHPHAAHVAIES
jgi:hypothetical protein